MPADQSVIIGYRAFHDMLMTGSGVGELVIATGLETVELKLEPVVAPADNLNLYWFASCRTPTSVGGRQAGCRPEGGQVCSNERFVVSGTAPDFTVTAYECT